MSWWSIYCSKSLELAQLEANNLVGSNFWQKWLQAEPETRHHSRARKLPELSLVGGCVMCLMTLVHSSLHYYTNFLGRRRQEEGPSLYNLFHHTLVFSQVLTSLPLLLTRSLISFPTVSCQLCFPIRWTPSPSIPSTARWPPLARTAASASGTRTPAPSWRPRSSWTSQSLPAASTTTATSLLTPPVTTGQR